MFDGSVPGAFSSDMEEEKSERSFLNVLVINGNLLVMKLEREEGQIEPFLRQYLDLGFTEMMNFPCLKLRHERVEFREH
jgi:hypothetical protein